MNLLSIIRSLRNHVIIFLSLILVQFWLGMTINLEVPLPNLAYGGIPALLFYPIHYLPVLLHMVVAVAILMVSISFLALSIRTGSRALIITGAIGLAAILGAIYNGIEFLLSGQFFGYSIGMAMSAVSAIVVYAVSLYYMGVILTENAAPRI